jgi:hypothetical protein
MRIRTLIASAAVLASAGGMAGVAVATASAAPAAASVMSVQRPSVAPLFGAWHKMTVTLNGTTYTGYWVYMVRHFDGSLTGWLYDGNQDTAGIPGYLALHGDYANGVVQFNAMYPNGDPQGDRGFLAINSGGPLHGIWNETGPEGGAGTFAFVS